MTVWLLLDVTAALGTALSCTGMMYLQASKSVFEGLSAKLSEHVGQHDTRPPQSAREESAETREPAAHRHSLESVSGRHTTLLDRLSLQGRLTVQPGGCAPLVSILKKPFSATDLHEAPKQQSINSRALPLYRVLFKGLFSTSPFHELVTVQQSLLCRILQQRCSHEDTQTS